MEELKFDLMIRFDETSQRFLFFATRRVEASSKEFSVDITLEELKSRGSEGAETLMGESVLGFFDHLANGKISLPKNYRED
jgi:hypothetical protein